MRASQDMEHLHNLPIRSYSIINAILKFEPQQEAPTSEVPAHTCAQAPILPLQLAILEALVIIPTIITRTTVDAHSPRSATSSGCGKCRVRATQLFSFVPYKGNNYVHCWRRRGHAGEETVRQCDHAREGIRARGRFRPCKVGKSDAIPCRVFVTHKCLTLAILACQDQEPFCLPLPHGPCAAN